MIFIIQFILYFIILHVCLLATVILIIVFYSIHSALTILHVCLLTTVILIIENPLKNEYIASVNQKFFIKIICCPCYLQSCSCDFNSQLQFNFFTPLCKNVSLYKKNTNLPCKKSLLFFARRVCILVCCCLLLHPFCFLFHCFCYCTLL